MTTQLAGARRLCVRHAVLGVLAAFSVGSARGSQILEEHSATLTKYEAAATPVQGALPNYLQRGVFLDGTSRAPAPFGWALAGNPFGEAWNGSARLGSVSLVTGTYEVTETDLALPAPGMGGWVVGRTYNAQQWTATDSGGGVWVKTHSDSNGYQGRNWFQSSQPEIKIAEGASDDLDVLYLVYGADRYVEFKRQGTSGTAFNTFKGVNGAAGAVLFTPVGTSGEPDTFTLYDQVGNRAVFFGFDADAGAAAGQLWKTIDTAGNTAFVGDSSTGSAAVSAGFDGSGRILFAYDAADRRYSYTYTTLDSVVRLTQVKAETKSSGTWASPGGVAEVGRVEYSYYQTGATTYGDAGNLRTVKITTPLSPSGISSVAQKYYRYWTGTYNAATNPGHPYSLQYVLNFEGTRAYDWTDSTLNDSFLTATESSLKPFAESYFEYDSSQRIRSFWGNGQCGCSGTGNGTHALSYPVQGALGSTSGYSADITFKTEVDPPETKALFQQHFDKAGQPLSRMDTSSSGLGLWGSGVFGTAITGDAVTRSASGVISDHSARSNLTAFDNNKTIFTEAFIRSDTLGLTKVSGPVTSGDLTGLKAHDKWKKGTGGSANLSATTEYTSASVTVGSVGLVRPLVSDRWAYSQTTTTEASGGSGPAGSYRTRHIYTMHTGDAALRPKIIETVAPAVATANNGENQPASTLTSYRTDGRAELTKSADGNVDYTGYNTFGLVSTRIVDAYTGHADLAGSGNPGDWSTPNTASHLKTTYTYDAQGRLDTTTHPDGRVSKNFYTRLSDQRLVTVSVPRVSGGTSYGPASYTVSNHAGRVEAQGILPISTAGTSTSINSWVANTSSDPISALHADTGGVRKLVTNLYDDSGTQVLQTRTYFSVPSSGAGTEGTHYDAVRYSYDGAGRRTKTVDATGTIESVAYDARSRVTSRSVGTDDGVGTSNMEVVEAMVYDGGNAGDGLLTSRTQYAAAGSGSPRTTTYSYDARHRVVLTASPTAPHSLVKYDNLGRVVASGQYSSTSGLTAASDPTSVATNRLALSETFYDERGRAWKTVRHKIDPADGSDDDTLVSQSWFDSMGRVIKSQGEQLIKTVYDRLGRATRTYTLASTNDSAYADASGVAGDIVMEETVTGYEAATGNALIRATVSRNWNDRDSGSGQTTGALDTNGDSSDLKVTAANVTGRVQIRAMWYDALNRPTDTAQYGTNNGSDLDRSGLSAPARSDTVLVASTSYNAMGLVEDVTDPRGLIARTVYDHAGRRVTSIANYVNGTPSGANGDDDLHTRYAYTSGLQTQMWVDIDGDGVQDTNDQVTTYAFGVTKGSGTMDSSIASNRLLASVAYPDTAGGTDKVFYAYNALGQQKAVKDQAGNILTSTFDNAGRQTARTVDTLISGFDGAVRRVETAFDTLGRPTTVTQYDATTSGTVVDEVKSTYDAWGNPAGLFQDVNSAVAASGGDDWSVQLTHAKSAPAAGRQTLRVTAQDLYRAQSSKQGVTYDYLSSSGRHDDTLSRVSAVKAGGTTVASYEYLGMGRVANVRLDPVSVFTSLYDPAGSAGAYANMDRFGRVTASKWTKDLSTDVDFYHIANTFDRNSNLTLWDDQIYPGWDSSVTVDGLNRVTKSASGTWSGSAIASATRTEDWTVTGLDQLGNWTRYKRDLNADGDWADADELDDTRTHNLANELTGRDTDTSGVDNYALTYDAVGNLTNDGQTYKFEYDAFGRLRKIRDQSNNLVEEFRYNGLNHRIAWLHDADADNDVDGSDPWFYFVYDRSWRMVASYRGSDAEAKELFVNHQAGLNGTQTSLPLDATILRDRENSALWAQAADGSSHNRAYYVQNYFGGRGDVVAILSSSGSVAQQVRYSAYGVPHGMPAGDTDFNGSIVGTPDVTQMLAWTSGPYTVRGDYDLDGDVDNADVTIASGNFGIGLGWNALSTGPTQSLSGVLGGHRKGYCGYEHDGTNPKIMHVRHRAYLADLGRWTRRDPLGYVDGGNLYGYVNGSVVVELDASGLCVGGRRCPTGMRAALGDDWRSGWICWADGRNCTPSIAVSPECHAITAHASALHDDALPMSTGLFSYLTITSAGSPDCSNPTYCYDLYQSRLSDALNAFNSCMASNVPPIGLYTALCLAACGAGTAGPISYACASLCGLAGSIAAMIDFQTCSEAFAFAAETAKISYCACMNWKMTHCTNTGCRELPVFSCP